jgi:hypothetical protein
MAIPRNVQSDTSHHLKLLIDQTENEKTLLSGRFVRCLLRIKKPHVPLPEARGHVEVTFVAPTYEGTQD